MIPAVNLLTGGMDTTESARMHGHRRLVPRTPVSTPFLCADHLWHSDNDHVNASAVDHHRPPVYVLVEHVHEKPPCWATRAGRAGFGEHKERGLLGDIAGFGVRAMSSSEHSVMGQI